jgi:hypothetical protein
MPTTYPIVKGNQYMDATTYTSTGTTQTVTNNGSFKPDLLWVKNRSITQNNYLSDSNRGVANILVSNATSAQSNSPLFVTSLNSNGFSFGTDNTANGNSMVGWNWQAGQGTTSTNTTGTITSTVSVNQTAGVSIVKYNGTGASGTVGHGLGAVPSMIIVKTYNQIDSWLVYHIGCPNPATNTMILNDANAVQTSSLNWNSTAPTASVFSVYNPGTGGYTSGSGYSYVAYCWAPVPGYSQFGNYTGNSSTSGPFIYTGFQPKFLMVRNTTSGAGVDWQIVDSSRSPNNQMTNLLQADLSVAEQNTPVLDFLSNGFRLTSTYLSINTSANNYIYMAFASNPFKYSNAF